MARLAALLLIAAVAAAGITAIGSTPRDTGSASVTADGTITPNGGGGGNTVGCPSCV
jgi:hypothetical protein